MKFLILFVVAMVISAIGFKKFVWFISLGYGFSIARIGVAMLLLFHSNKTVSAMWDCSSWFAAPTIWERCSSGQGCLSPVSPP